MKKADALKRIGDCEPIILAEWRSHKVEVVSYRDKTTGRPMVFKKVLHNLECGSRPVTLTERMADDADEHKYLPPFKKGQTVALMLETMTREKSAFSATGTLELVEV